MAVDWRAWLRAHKGQATLGAGAAGAVGIGLYRRHKANADPTAAGNNAVPTGATTGATTGVIPYAAGYDTAGGIPYDPSATGLDPSGYLPQISQQLSNLNASEQQDATLLGGLGATLNKIARNTKKPTTGGKSKKPPRSPKPKAKTTKHPRSRGHNPAPKPPARKHKATRPNPRRK